MEQECDIGLTPIKEKEERLDKKNLRLWLRFPRFEKDLASYQGAKEQIFSFRVSNTVQKQPGLMIPPMINHFLELLRKSVASSQRLRDSESMDSGGCWFPNCALCRRLSLFLSSTMSALHILITLSKKCCVNEVIQCILLRF